LARRTSPDTPATPRERRVALLLTVMVAALGVLFYPASPAAAADVCRLAEWKKQWKQCAEKLPPANDPCLDPPVPSAPDSGLAGWFADRSKASKGPHNPGVYIDYGYAGYDFHTYGLRCGAAGADPGIATENMIANWELKLASGVVGASNAAREKAWDPGSLWSWADKLLKNASETIYKEVFTGFGAVTLTVVGIYLIWRSRQADMSDSMTTAGWAVLVMLVVTAVAVYPVWSANLADGVLTQSLDVVHSAVGPRDEKLTPDNCEKGNCDDPRLPAERGSEIATEAVLYRSWLRGTLGSDNSKVAVWYGKALYDAQAFSWKELERIEKAKPEKRQGIRDSIIKAKQDRFNRIAEQIKREDPEAYEHLQGKHGADRIGAGFIALISAVFFGFFDLVASVLVLLAFMIFRWAVIAAPLVGTVAILRPASSGLKRIGNAVVAAIFNILIFGAGAAIYLLAVDVITSTGGLGGWLQVLLVGLCGVAAWILLRPYQRLTQLGGGSGGQSGGFRDRLLGRSPSRDTEDQSRGPATTATGDRVRPENRSESPILLGERGESRSDADPADRRGGRERAGIEAPATGDTPTSGRPDARPGVPAGSPPPGGGEEPDTDREVIAGNEVRIVRDEPTGYHGDNPDSRRTSADTTPGYETSTEEPAASRPLYVPDEWRDEYSNRT
ncbi:MAG: hypothetical protein ACRD0P_19625, partial [Stackebrandtia sp.]